MLPVKWVGDDRPDEDAGDGGDNMAVHRYSKEGFIL